MKYVIKIIFVLILTICSEQISAQGMNVDSLIDKINNRQLDLKIEYQSSFVLTEDYANQLISLGKEITPNLISILENKSKGIIAHYVLTKIWLEKIDELGLRRNDISEETIYLNGLPMFFCNRGEFCAQENELIQVKKYWTRLTEKK